MAVSLATLLVQGTKAKFYSTAIGIARAIGVPVDTWQVGDPTRSQYHVLATFLEKLEVIVFGFIGSGFLDYAKGDWLEIVAKQVFNVDVPPATTAVTDVVLTNSGGGFYEIDPGDLTFRNTTTGKTYRNVTGGILNSGAGEELTLTVEADEAGSASTANAEEIDFLVTTLLGVTCSNPTAAVGRDKQDPAVTIQQCRDKIDSWSPNGPRGAYAFVARNPAKAGTTAVTRVRVFSESDTGDVTVYLAGSSGAIPEPDRVLVEAAILKWATPLCITPSVYSATNKTIAVTYQLWAYESINLTEAQLEAEVEEALTALFQSRPIGGDIIPPATTGAIYQSLIESTIRALYPQIFRVIVALPSLEATPIDNDEVAVLGAVTPTSTTFVADS